VVFCRRPWPYTRDLVDFDGMDWKGKPNMNGRRFVPTESQRKQVEAMASYGVRQEDIARVIGCDAKTLRKHFRDELDVAEIKATSMVAQNLFRMATAWPPIPGTTAPTAMFWMKARAGWRQSDPAGEDSAVTGKKAVAQAEAERVAGDASGEWSGLLTVPPLEPARGKPN